MKLPKYITLLLLALISLSSAAQTSDAKISTHTYKDTLQLDFYSSLSTQNGAPPLLVLLHGGGFASGTRNGVSEVRFSEIMAEKGFAVASISYRLTRKNDPFNCDCDTEKKLFSFISACEDLSEAIHFMTNEKSLFFDRETMVLVGSSAGAEAILHSGFMGNDYRFNHIPKFNISGLVSFSGAISNAAYITKNNAVPTLLIHGKKDKLVPYATAPHHYCSEDASGYLMLDGPQTIAAKLHEMEASYILAYDNEGGHDWAFKAYKEVELINRFLNELVLNDQKIQETVELKAVKE
ncbi:alpha/beta hydrolase [Lutimonas sp.]|uniref:alpha/beta hydrolase n=1 Tax=Lutimonas sp. TaxID=1872403 RepID=UPI003D9BE904